MYQKEARDIPLIEKGNTFHHSCFTNQVLYADLMYELPEIEVKDLPLLSLFAKLLRTRLGGRTYEETLHFQQAYIGGFDAALGLHVAQENPDWCDPSCFLLKRKALLPERTTTVTTVLRFLYHN